MSNTVTGIVLSGLAGVLLLWLGLHDAARVRRLRHHGTQTDGMVVDNVREGNNGPGWLVPVVSFVDQRGQRVEFKPPMRGVGMGLTTGRAVTVIYLPDDPQTARVLMRRHMTGPVYFLLASALAFLCAVVAIAASA